MRLPAYCIYVIAFFVAAGAVVAIGLGAAAAVQNEAYNEQLLQTSLKAANWGMAIRAQFQIINAVSESAATSIAYIADTLPSPTNRFVRLDPQQYADLGDRIFSTYPGLTFINTFSDLVFSDCYPANAPVSASLGLDVSNNPTVKYLHDVKADGKTRAKYLPSTVDGGGGIIGCTSRIMVRDPANKTAPPKFFGVVSVVARLAYFTDVIFDLGVPAKEGFAAEVDVIDGNVTSVIATSQPANSTTLWEDDEDEVVQTINMESAGVWRLRVRPLNGWKGDIRGIDIGITVAAAVVAGILAVLGLRWYVLARDKEAALRADAVRSDAQLEFAGYIYHEIRNPTHALLATLEMAPPAVKELQDYRILRNATTMIHRLLDSALDLLKLESGKTVLEAAPVAIVELVEECVAMSRPRLPHKHMSMVLSIAPDVPAYVRTDPLRLQQVIMNLLSNAAKYCRDTVQMSLELVPGDAPKTGDVSLLFTVRDDGKGIDAAMRPRLFTRFAQARASTTREHGGTGLGLCISKGFIDLMGGTIVCDSVVDEYTAFEIRLTLPPCEAATSRESAVGSSTGDTLENGMLEHLNVLYVDDNEINRKLGARAMKMWTGHDCELAVDGEDAVKQFAAALNCGLPFDVVFMDLTMPVMDGWTATAAIRDLERDAAVGSPVWIAALSGSCITSDVDKAHRCGIDEFLTKPCSIETTRRSLIRAVLKRGSDELHASNKSARSNPLAPIGASNSGGSGLIVVSDE